MTEEQRAIEIVCKGRHEVTWTEEKSKEYNKALDTVLDLARREGLEREKVEQCIREVDYPVDEYEVRGDNGDYSPNEDERFLIQDYTEGLIEEIIEAICDKFCKPEFPSTFKKAVDEACDEKALAMVMTKISEEKYNGSAFTYNHMIDGIATAISQHIRGCFYKEVVR